MTAIYNNVKAGVKVSMHVQGQGRDIQLVPTSEPPLTESEIYTLLATGRTNLKRGSGGSEIGSAQAVSVPHVPCPSPGFLHGSSPLLKCHAVT